MDKINISGHDIPKLSTTLKLSDYWGSLKVRLDFNRMDYKVTPGLYAVGDPTQESPVLVTANYKLTVDTLRKELSGLNLWILVLDTKGINVWCAAGKGTFGTAELVHRIEATKLSEIVKHKEIIVPQLGAVGVSAHKVKELSGFKVIYGPVRAKDIKAFLDAGKKADATMRRVQFSLVDRLVLVPLEFVTWNRYIAFFAACFFLLAGLSKNGYSSVLALKIGGSTVFVLLTAYIAGGVLGPALLPWLPGRAFATKGFWLGALISLSWFFMQRDASGIFANGVDMTAWMILTPVLTSFLLMNFTGASTYTSLSGVTREMKYAVPLQKGFALLGVCIWIARRFF